MVEPRGLFGERLTLCRERLLLAKDETALLAGFVRRPGSHPWIGEHVGKWLDAACCELERTRDARLAAKIERVVTMLRAAQEPDGYLGTYEPAARWSSWDVWVHKYVLLGLLAHHRATGDAASLDCARRVGELLVRTFHTGHGGSLDLLSPRVSTHAGMAAGSVLVAIVKLFRATGEERFLDFARFVARRLSDEEGGPRIGAGLRAGRGVHEIGNGKAYELLSCLCGFVDLSRVSGEREFAEAAKLAFDDVVRHQLYVTGGLSFEEHFRAPGTAPSVGDVSETCALVTWMQLCVELFRFTGEQHFVAPFERAAWNHLLAAQRQDGSAFGYFTPLAGARRWRDDFNCCGSSGPRGLELVPQLVAAVQEPLLGEARAPARVELPLLIDARARIAVAGGRVELEVATNFGSCEPLDAPRRATISARSDVGCELVVHAPSWARRTTFDGREEESPCRVRVVPGAPRELVVLVLEPAADFELGHGRESGRRARLLGPLVLARPGGRVEAPLVPFFTAGGETPLQVWEEIEQPLDDRRPAAKLRSS